MLFNSYIFILVFLPATFAVFHALRGRGLYRSSYLALVAASLIFYGWWSFPYLLLLVFLILFNFLTAKAMIHVRARHPVLLKPFLCVGITANLMVLCYYKYANFFVDNVNVFFKQDLHMAQVLLPIGISFFTFQKIGLLIDIYQNKVASLDLLDYALFVTFFPQLIAGPITHHSEVIPQFKQSKPVTLDSISWGMTIFAIGLSKKVMVADTIAKFATLQFNVCAKGQHLDFLAAWSAALSYAVQLYFDFSAYSDMAIGIGLLFGIHLPVNFNSPYKSKSIIEFWQRWHMTLSRFLRDYLYIPLGGNRKGPVRRYVNLLLTMLLGGIWHGAGWTFVVWGALHGTYLIINHGWRALLARLNISVPENNAGANLCSQALTFLAVLVGWVFFRAADVSIAWDILKSMMGLHGFLLPPSLAHWDHHAQFSRSPVDPAVTLVLALVLLSVTWFAPNTQTLMHYSGPEYSSHVQKQKQSPALQGPWRPTLSWALYAGFLFACSLMMLSKVSEFIYFQF